MNTQNKKTEIKPLFLGITVLFGIIFWFLPVPHGLSAAGWHTLAIFITFILGCILNAAPMGILSITTIAILGITQLIEPKIIFASFGAEPIWLVAMAFFVAIGFTKTGLGKRIAFSLVKIFGKNSLMLGYAMVLCDLVVAPFIPSNNARGAGIGFPLTTSLSKALGSTPEAGTGRKIGSFLILISFHANLLTGALFLTAMATNPMAISLAGPIANIKVDWLTWLKLASVPAITALVIVPLFIYFIHRPSVTKLPEAKSFAQKELNKMGKITLQEKIMLTTFGLMIILWATTSITHINATIVSVIGLAILLLTQVVQYQDILAEKNAWNILLWLAPLIMLAGQLNAQGVVKWFSQLVQQNVQGLSWQIAMLLLALIYYYSHYFFTSVLVHMQAMYVPFVAILIGLGAPALVTVMLFALLTCICPATTNYGTGTATIYFGTGYLTQKEWLRIGFLVSVVELIIFIGIGGLWWKILGIF